MCPDVTHAGKRPVEGVLSLESPTVGVKLKFPFGFCSTEPKRCTVLTKNSYKTDKQL